MKKDKRFYIIILWMLISIGKSYAGASIFRIAFQNISTPFVKIKRIPGAENEYFCKGSDPKCRSTIVVPFGETKVLWVYQQNRRREIWNQFKIVELDRYNRAICSSLISWLMYPSPSKQDHDNNIWKYDISDLYKYSRCLDVEHSVSHHKIPHDDKFVRTTRTHYYTILIKIGKRYRTSGF